MARRSARKGACCAGQDIHDARAVADRLGIPHYVLDYESALPRRGDRRFRRQLPARRDADPVRALQPARSSSATCWRSRATSAPTALATGHYVAARRRRRRAGAASRRRSRARPELLPVRDDARAARLPALPARRPAEGGDARAGARLRTAGRRQARQPGHLLRAERPLRTRWSSGCGPGALEPGEIVHVDGRVLGPA